METISKFTARKDEAKKLLDNLKETNAREEEIHEAKTMYLFWEVMELEEGEILGALLHEFAVLVDFDPKLIEPIASKDAGFWSDIEGMGHLQFHLNRLQLERTKRTISLLRSINFGIKRLVEVLAPNITNKDESLQPEKTQSDVRDEVIDNAFNEFF